MHADMDRHWDTWLTDKKNAIFAGTLTGGDQYTFDGNMTNLMVGLQNVTRAETPVMPDGDPADYEISPDGNMVAFRTKNIDLPLANFTSSPIYLVPFSGVSQPQIFNGIGMSSTPPDAQGYSTSPVFSSDSSQLAYLQMDGINYESDRNKIYIANADVANPNITVLCEDWDFSPAGVAWGANDTGLYVHGAYRGNSAIFDMIPLDAGADYAPSNITGRGAVAGMSVLPDGNILVSDAKFWSSRDFYTISPTGDTVTDLLRANEVDEQLAGLDESIQTEFYYAGNFTDVQSFIIYPEGFDESQTYPLAFLVHGGPQSQWSNSWSTRWNMKVWADQGYVVVAPNPTGSNGFGQAFQDAIQNNWGSYPADDLAKCFEYVRENLSYIDTDRAIAAGASYGGYMMNWIQGHDLGREFKALVTHDGSTDTLAQYTSEELWFMQHDVSLPFLPS